MVAEAGKFLTAGLGGALATYLGLRVGGASSGAASTTNSTKADRVVKAHDAVLAGELNQQSVNNKRLRKAEENRLRLVRESQRWRQAADTAERALMEARAGTKTDADLLKRLKRLEELERGLSQARPSSDTTRELHITRDLLERVLRQRTSPLQQQQDQLAMQQATLRKELARVRAAQVNTQPVADTQSGRMKDDGAYRQAVRDLHEADIALASMRAQSAAHEQTVQDLRRQLDEAKDDRIPAVHVAVMRAESDADIGRQALNKVERLAATKARVAESLGQQITADTTNVGNIKSKNALEKLRVQAAAAEERAAAAEREVGRVIDAGNRRNGKFAEMHRAIVERLQGSAQGPKPSPPQNGTKPSNAGERGLEGSDVQRLQPEALSYDKKLNQIHGNLREGQNRAAANLKQTLAKMAQDGRDQQALSEGKTAAALQALADARVHANRELQRQVADSARQVQDKLTNTQQLVTTQARTPNNVKQLQDRLDDGRAAQQAAAQQLANTRKSLNDARAKANAREDDIWRKASQETAAVRQTTEEIKALLQQNQSKAADLMARLGTGDNQYHTVSKQADAITTLTGTVDRLTTQAAAAQQQLIEAQAQASTVEANRARSTAESERQHQNRLQQAEAQSKAAVQAAEATVSELQSKLDEAVKMQQQVQKALEESEARAAGAVAGKEESAVQLQATTAELSKMQQEISSLQAASEQQQTAARSALEARQAEVEKLKEEADKSTEKVAALTKEAEDAKRQGLDSAEALSRQLEAETSEKKAALEALQSGQALVDKLKAEVAAAGETEASNKAKLASLSNQLQATEAARNKLEHNLQDTTKNAATLRSDADGLRQQSADLQQRLDASLEAARTQLQNHNRQSTELKSQVANLQKARGVDKSTIDELKRHVQAAAEEKSRLEHQVADSARAAATALTNLDQHRVRVNTLQANLGEEKAKVRAREEAERKLQMDLISHQEREKALEAAAADLEAKIKANEAVTAELTKQHDSVLIKLQQAVATVDSSEKTLAEKSAEILKLTDQVKAQDVEHAGLKQELAEAAVGLAEGKASRERVEALTAAMGTKEAELQAGREELKSQNLAWQQLLAEKQRIEKEVDERQAQHEALVSQEKQKYSELMLDYTKVSQELKDRLAAVEAGLEPEGVEVSAAQLAVERDLEKLIELGAGEQYTADLATLRSKTSTAEDKTKVLDKAKQYQQALVKLRKSAFVNVIVNQWDARRKAWSTTPFPISVVDRTITIDGSKRYKDFYSVRTWSPQSPLSELFTAKEPGRAALEDNVREAATGMNSVIFTYGQSGSGKTASLLGRPGEEGLTGLALQLLLGLRCLVVHGETFCLYGQIKMAEVCNAPAGKTQMEALAKLTCTRKTPSNAVYKGTSVTPDTIKEVFRRRPDVHPTPNNDESSRSHLFMTWSVTNPRGDRGYLTFVDLAGAESPAAIALVEKQQQLRERQLDPTKKAYLKDALYNMLYNWNTQPKQQRPQGRTVIDTLHEGFYINETLNNLADFFVYRKGHSPQPRTVQPLTKRWLAPDMESYKPSDGLADRSTSEGILRSDVGSMFKDPTGFMLELNALEGLQRNPAQMAAVVVVNPTTPTEMQGVRDTLDYADRLTK